MLAGWNEGLQGAGSRLPPAAWAKCTTAALSSLCTAQALQLQCAMACDLGQDAAPVLASTSKSYAASAVHMLTALAAARCASRHSTLSDRSDRRARRRLRSERSAFPCEQQAAGPRGCASATHMEVVQLGS